MKADIPSPERTGNQRGGIVLNLPETARIAGQWFIKVIPLHGKPFYLFSPYFSRLGFYNSHPALADTYVL
jgi:hypothetical protein